MKAVLRWLGSAPIGDPVDRRNAPFLQSLLLFFGIFVPINKAIFLYAVVGGHVPRPDALRLSADLATDVLLVASAWVALWWIRRGRFRQGVALFLSVAAACVGIAYASVGLAQVGLDPIPLVLLSLAALVLGRWALGLMLAALTAMLLGCLALDMLRAASPPAVAIGKAVSIGGIWLLISLVLDRTVAALRRSLEESEQRRRDLEAAHLRLQEETAERERTREQLIHSQKLDVAGRLASGLSHDFNNLLAITLGYAQQRNQLAAQGGEPALVAALERVEQTTRRAMAVSHKLLDFSRLEMSQPETFDAGAALQDLRPMLRQLLGPRIELRLERPDASLPVRMDRGSFELAVLNIAGNARDALAAAGAGTFRIAVTRDAAGGSLVLDLSDDGPGIPEPIRHRVFTPFFTTKPRGEGTGLGLSVVRDVIAGAGGDIAIECPPSGGTTVRIVLPLASQAG